MSLVTEIIYMREYKIAAIPGDGIGVEVIAAGLKVLEVLAGRDGGFGLNVEHFPWSSDYYHKHGHYIPEGGLDELKHVRRDLLRRGRRARRARPRFALGPAPADLPGLRPVRERAPRARAAGRQEPARRTASAIDWVIIRENSEGEYSGCGGRVHRGLPDEVATETSVFTRAASSAFTASPSSSRASARASTSRSSPSRTRSATAW